MFENYSKINEIYNIFVKINDLIVKSGNFRDIESGEISKEIDFFEQLFFLILALNMRPQNPLKYQNGLVSEMPEPL